MRRLLLLAALALGAAPSAFAQGAGQEWPGREPIRLIVCAPAGSTVDLTARLWADALKDRLGATIVVEPRPGGAGVIGAQAVARAAPDGHTLGVCFPGPFTMRPHLAPTPGFDPLADLRAVAILMTAPFLFVADAAVAKDLSGLLAAARARDLSYASVGNGSLAHLGMELFLARTGVKMVHVPYRGSPEAITDLLGGRVAAFITPLSAVQGQIAEGKLTPIFTTGPSRMPQLPSVPTAREAGLPDLEVVTWHGLFAPAATPAPIVAKLSAAVLSAARDDARLREGLGRAGSDLVAMTPDQAAAMIAAESTTWAEVIRTAGIKAE
jgi:tripartite-type tricarboxylate transporter receptor subunit TctC